MRQLTLKELARAKAEFRPTGYRIKVSALKEAIAYALSRPLPIPRWWRVRT